MKILTPNEAGLQEAVEVLRRDGVVIHATETCYGIACDLQSPAAVGRLFAVKKRPFDQPVSALFESWNAVKTYVQTSPKAESLAKLHLPGPVTLVLPRRIGAPPLWVTSTHAGHDPMIGVRVSPHPIAHALVLGFGWPIATTSANLHGKENPYSIDDILSQFQDSSLQPDIILDSGKLAIAPPSTVAEVIDDRVRVLRQGATHLSSLV